MTWLLQHVQLTACPGLVIAPFHFGYAHTELIMLVIPALVRGSLLPPAAYSLSATCLSQCLPAPSGIIISISYHRVTLISADGTPTACVAVHCTSAVVVT